MRICRENTLIENNLYPFAGNTPEEIIDYFTKLFSPFAEILYQIEGALLFHNIPLYLVICLLSTMLLYASHIVVVSSFPTFFYLISLIPLIQFFRSIGAFTMFKSLTIELPKLPQDAPNRIRTLKEIIELIYPLLAFIWRFVFFIYRTFLCPNFVDTLALLLLFVFSGFIVMVLDFTIVLIFPLLIILLAPGILTRKSVYDGIMRHLGHPLPEDDD